MSAEHTTLLKAAATAKKLIELEVGREVTLKEATDALVVGTIEIPKIEKELKDRNSLFQPTEEELKQKANSLGLPGQLLRLLGKIVSS